MRIVHRIGDVSRESWRALEPRDFPFFDHEFLLALEESRSVGGRTGWQPVYLLCEDADGRLFGALPFYLKGDSYGEYVFDWDWAHAYHEHGLPYYPKLVAAVPFTPATGPKILVNRGLDAGSRLRVTEALLDAADATSEDLGVSSTHALFLTQGDLSAFSARGYLIRHSLQFHWSNPGYEGFHDFLGTLSGKRRRQISRERRQLAGEGLSIDLLTGPSLLPEHADLMYGFYLSTYDRKWGDPYLTRDFFRRAFATMSDRTLLVMARDASSKAPVAGSLFFHKGRSLYGRYWGAARHTRNLHFELCYYQGIEFAIQNRMTLFEAGAQGEHKLARGFLPAATLSAHQIRHPAFRHAIADYLRRERSHTASTIKAYSRHSPYLSP